MPRAPASARNGRAAVFATGLHAVERKCHPTVSRTPGRGRSFRPSCEKANQLLWAEWLREELVAPVPHRHVVLTSPRLLRPLVRCRRKLLTELVRTAAEATGGLVRRAARTDACPGGPVHERGAPGERGLLPAASPRE